MARAVTLTMVSCLRVDKNQRLGRNDGSIPVDFCHCFPGQTHSANGVVAASLFDDRVHVRDFFLLDARSPRISDIRVISLDILIRTVLPHLALLGRKRPDSRSQRAGNRLEATRDQRETDRRDLDAAQLRLFVFENGCGYARLVCAFFDHFPDFIKEKIQIGVSPFSQLLGSGVFLVVREVAHDGDVVLEVLGGAAQERDGGTDMQDLTQQLVVHCVHANPITQCQGRV